MNWPRFVLGLIAIYFGVILLLSPILWPLGAALFIIGGWWIGDEK